ncbi:MAG: hypothetical protein JW982_13525 [Spirochaetes bacterium]|nr:hypothetical protein [Spirochaetota bacterium]
MKKLTKREQLMLKILAVLSIAAAAYFAISGFSNFNSGNPDTDFSEKNVFKVLDGYSNEYHNIKKEISDYNNILNNQNDSLNTQIQSVADSLNISKNIEYTKRTQTNLQNKYIKITVDVKINGADIQSLLQFISKIEDRNKLVFITYVNIRKGIKEKELYDALIKISTFSKN